MVNRLASVETGRSPRLGCRWCIGRRVMNFIRHFPRRLFEFLDARAQSLGQFRNFLGTEQKQDGQNHDDPFHAPKPRCQYDIHII